MLPPTIGARLAVDRFGASAPGEVVMREHRLSVDNVCRRALALLLLETPQRT